MFKSTILVAFVTLLNLTTISNILASDLDALMFMPQKGKFLNTSAFVIQKNWYNKTKVTTNVKEYELNENSFEFNNEFRYAFLDILNFGINLGYVLSDNYTKTVPGNPATDVITKSNGLKDITFLTRFRLLDEKVKPVSLDFELSLSPSLQNKIEPGANNSGNALRGSHKFILNTYVGKNVERFSWMAQLSLIYSTKSIGESSTTGIEITDYDSSFDFNILTKVQLKMNEQFSMDVGISFYNQGKKKQTDRASAVATDFESQMNVSGLFNLNYELMKSKLLLDFGFEYSINADNNYSTNGIAYVNEKSGMYKISLGASFYF